MNPNMATAVSVGLLVWAWTFASLGYLEPRLLTWITFLTWACFYAAGAGKHGITKSIASGIVGVMASAAVMWLATQIGAGSHHLLILSLLLGVLGWVLCIVSAIPLLSCIPANFIGAAAFFGAGAPMDLKLIPVVCSIVVGALLGLSSQWLAGALTRTTSRTVVPENTQSRQGRS